MATQKTAQAEGSADLEQPVVTPELPTGGDLDNADQPTRDVAPKEPTEAAEPEASPESSGRIAELEAQLATEKVAREKAEGDKELATKGQSALDRRLKSLEQKSQQPTTDWDLTLTLAKQLDEQRGDGEITTERAVLQRQQAEQQKTVESERDSSKLIIETALQDAGISFEDWGVQESWEDTRLKWEMAIALGNYDTANRIASRITGKKVGAVVTPADGEPESKKSAAQRRAEMSTDGGSDAGGGVVAQPTAETIDKLYLDWESKHSDKPNPYAAKYRQLVETGTL